MHSIEACGVSGARGSRSLLRALHVAFESDKRHLGNQALAITVNAAFAATDAATFTILQQTPRTSNHELSICKQRAGPLPCSAPLSSAAASPHPYI